MDEAERKALISGMSAACFALGDLYNEFWRVRQNPDFRRRDLTAVKISACYPPAPSNGAKS